MTAKTLEEIRKKREAMTEKILAETKWTTHISGERYTVNKKAKRGYVIRKARKGVGFVINCHDLKESSPIGLDLLHINWCTIDGQSLSACKRQCAADIASNL